MQDSGASGRDAMSAARYTSAQVKAARSAEGDAQRLLVQAAAMLISYPPNKAAAMFYAARAVLKIAESDLARSASADCLKMIHDATEET